MVCPSFLCRADPASDRKRTAEGSDAIVGLRSVVPHKDPPIAALAIERSATLPDVDDMGQRSFDRARGVHAARPFASGSV